MPVIDHEIHERTIEKHGAVYGCHNFTHRKQYLTVKDGHGFDEDIGIRQLWKRIDYTMSNECRYDMSLTDIKCDGCRHRGSGEAYSDKVKEIGK